MEVDWAEFLCFHHRGHCDQLAHCCFSEGASKSIGGCMTEWLGNRTETPEVVRLGFAVTTKLELFLSIC